jgi:capsular polysaccharide biosynthesis protein
MTLSATDGSYATAANMVNAVAKVFQEQIPQIMKVDNVTILTEANPESPAAPINRQTMQSVFVSAAITLMLAIGLVIFLEYMDSTLKYEEDIAEVLGYPTLASIPRTKSRDFKIPRKHRKTRETGEASYAASIK